MKANTAREIAAFFGCLILVAALPAWGAAFALLKGGGLGMFGSLAFIMLNPAFLLANAAAILLILKRSAGFICIYVSTLAGLIWLGGPILPRLKHIFPAGPEYDYYVKAANICAVLFLSYCHWRIASEEEQRTPRVRRVIIAFLVLLIPSVIFWKTGIRIGIGELQKISEVPSVGQYLLPLESSQPILYRSSESPRMRSAIVVFRGMTTEGSLREFASFHHLKLMTNEASRTKIIPQAKSWKLDPERFPIFTNDTDLCFIGRIPTNSRAVFQLCFRPSDGRFTAMSMGNPNEARAASTAAPPRN